MPVPDAGSPDDARWRELAEAAAEPNPFYEPAFVRPAVAHLGAGTPALLVVGRDRWKACLPVSCRPGLVESWRHDYRFLGTPLIHRDHVDEGVTGLVRRPGTPSLLVLHQLAADGPVRRAIDRWSPFGLGVQERAAAWQRPEDDYRPSTLSSASQREMRRQTRKLTADLGPLEIVDRADDPTAVDDFLALESAGWKGRLGTALASAGHGPFFRELCAGFAAEGRMYLPEARSGGHRLAMSCNFRAGDGMFTFKLAFDEDYRRYAPGVRLEEQMPSVMHADPRTHWLDSCAAPDNDMINRLWPDRRRLEHVLVPPPNRTGRLALLALRPAVRWRAGRHA